MRIRKSKSKRLLASASTLLATLALAATACGQGSNTIYTTLATNATAAPVSGFYGPVRNIGQAAHQAYMVIGTISGHTTCVYTQVTATATFYGNSVASTATAKPMPQLAQSPTAAGANTAYVAGSSYYPYVYVAVGFTDPSGDCNYSLNYAGGTQTLTLIDNNDVSATVTSATGVAPGTYVIGTAQTARGYLVYGMTVSMTGGAGSVALACSLGLGPTITYPLAVDATVVNNPGTKIPILICSRGSTLSIVVTGGTAAYYVRAAGGIQVAQPFLF